jgi:threonine/homoserine/homoserine lactone efflux protein
VIAGTHDLALFAFTVFVLNATPGVDMAFALVATLRGGVRAGLAASAGVCSGCVVHVLASAFGMAALLAASAAAFTLVKWAGAAYLLWLAWGLLCAGLAAAPAGAPAAAQDAPPSLSALWRQGFLTNVLNPKVALFFLALLPQFIAADAPNKTAAFLGLGAWAVVQGALFLAVFVVAVAPLRRLAQLDGPRRALQLAGSALFAALAVRLALAERA